jgi:tyrosine-protein phosphatase SIW14
MSLFPPVNFSAVEDGLYRSGMPFEINFEVSSNFSSMWGLVVKLMMGYLWIQFIKTLRLKTVIVLSSTYVDDTVSKFFEENSIQVVYIENSVSDALQGVLPFAEEMVTEALTVIADKNNSPAVVVCKTGWNLTGVVIACLRKLQKWSLISIYEEYRRYAGGLRLQQQHEQFIELFDTDLIPIGSSAPPFLLKRIKPA